MKFIIIIAIISVMLIGCDDHISEAKSPRSLMTTICLDGVTYWVRKEQIGYQGYGYLSVKYNTDGTVETCTL